MAHENGRVKGRRNESDEARAAESSWKRIASADWRIRYLRIRIEEGERARADT